MKKKILFISATHGDEGFSIKVLDELEKKYPKDKYGFERIIGNPQALSLNLIQKEANLNRSAPGNLKSPLYEERRAAEIMAIAKRFQYVIDLHGANSRCGIVLIICKPSLPNFLLAGMFKVKKVVIWSTREDYQSGPLTQFCETGLEIECGPKTDKRIQKKLKMVLENFIKNYQKINIEEIMKNLKNKKFYAVYDKENQTDKTLIDFRKVRKGKEEYYPFMSNVYPNLACYKLRKIKFEELFLSLSKI
jgi:succinylglutamate desuccinylase